MAEQADKAKFFAAKTSWTFSLYDLLMFKYDGYYKINANTSKWMIYLIWIIE